MQARLPPARIPPPRDPSPYSPLPRSCHPFFSEQQLLPTWLMVRHIPQWRFPSIFPSSVFVAPPSVSTPLIFLCDTTSSQTPKGRTPPPQWPAFDSFIFSLPRFPLLIPLLQDAAEAWLTEMANPRKFMVWFLLFLPLYLDCTTATEYGSRGTPAFLTPPALSPVLTRRHNREHFPTQQADWRAMPFPSAWPLL